MTRPDRSSTPAIPAALADGLGAISLRTFGEAHPAFNALAGGDQKRTSFGSAHLERRSSDSYAAALKDFISPRSLDLNDCAKVII